MAAQAPQTFENHVRFVPAVHFVALPILAVNFFYAAYQAVAHFGAGTVIGLAVAVALVIVALFARVMTLTVQDRVIRLEERLRMRALLPADLQGRIEEFTPKQLVALALRERRGTPRAGQEGPRRENRGSEGNQADGDEVEGGLPTGVVGSGQCGSTVDHCVIRCQIGPP